MANNADLPILNQFNAGAGYGNTNFSSNPGVAHNLASMAANSPENVVAQTNQYTQMRGLDEQQRQFNLQQQFRKRILAMLNSSFQSQQGDTAGLLAQLNGAGEGERATINQNFQNTQNSSLARIENRGFGSSIIANNAISGLTRDKQLALGGLNDRLINQRIGIGEHALDRRSSFQSLLAGLAK